MSILSKNIRYLRKKYELSQEYISSSLGYKSFTTVQKWETGASEPPFKRLKQLSDLFKITMSELMEVDIEAIDTGNDEKAKKKLNLPKEMSRMVQLQFPLDEDQLDEDDNYKSPLFEHSMDEKKSFHELKPEVQRLLKNYESLGNHDRETIHLIMDRMLDRQRL